jgi:hypothetical protein
VVEGDPDPGEGGGDPLVLAVGQRPRRQAFALGRHHDRGAVLVGAGHHQQPVAGRPVVAAATSAGR